MKTPGRGTSTGAGGLRPGTRLGPYEVQAPLGAGGMGEVYRARDTRLGRDVAIKVLGREAHRDPARRRRFEREARLASAVTHPHVLTLFDVGEWEDRPYVVSELLEGETLRAHLRPRVLPWREAVAFGVQIARGLEALHDRGIVHRDLKPENLFVTKDNAVKILDLGLAGPIREGPVAEPGPWETLSTEGAHIGGTACYMSPEQVRCAPADPRSDIFSCGVVLYEMLACRRPFAEETAAETMTAILRREPPRLADVNPELPIALVGVVERCLEKSPENRFHSSHDLALTLETGLSAPSTSPRPRPAAGAPGSARVPASAPRRQWARPGLRAAVLALGLVAALSAWPTGGRKPTGAAGPVEASEAVVLQYDKAEGRFAPFLHGIAAEGVSFSRDGKWVAYVTHPEGELWRSRRDGSEPRRLTERPLQAALPRWSPDGRKITFSGRTDDGPWRIHIVSPDGGRWRTLPVERAADAGWTADGEQLIYGADLKGTPALFRWDLASRREGLLSGSVGLFSPRMSPDGRYLAALRSGSMELMVRDALGSEWTQLTRTPAAYPTWSPDGRWLHFRDEEDRAFYRIDPASGLRQRVADIGGLAMATGTFGQWSGVTPEGVPLLLHDLRGDEAREQLAKAMGGFQSLIEPVAPYASSTGDWRAERRRDTSRTAPRPPRPASSAH